MKLTMNPEMPQKRAECPKENTGDAEDAEKVGRQTRKLEGETYKHPAPLPK